MTIGTQLPCLTPNPVWDDIRQIHNPKPLIEGIVYVLALSILGSMMIYNRFFAECVIL